MGGDKELIDRLLAEYESPEEIVGLMKQLTKAIVERALQAELATYLCYDELSSDGQNNTRKRRNSRGLKGEFGRVETEGCWPVLPIEPRTQAEGRFGPSGYPRSLLSVRR